MSERRGNKRKDWCERECLVSVQTFVLMFVLMFVLPEHHHRSMRRIEGRERERVTTADLDLASVPHTCMLRHFFSGFSS